MNPKIETYLNQIKEYSEVIEKLTKLVDKENLVSQDSKLNGEMILARIEAGLRAQRMEKLLNNES